MSEIVVGVDGSEPARRALDWGIAEAGMRGTPLVAVHAWEPPVAPPELGAAGGRTGGVDLVEVVESTRREAEALVEGTLRSASAPRDNVELRPLLVEGSPADALLEAASDADLLVLGSHGHRPLTALVLGSVSHECLRRARCPVVVVPPERDG